MGGIADSDGQVASPENVENDPVHGEFVIPRTKDPRGRSGRGGAVPGLTHGLLQRPIGA